MSARYSSDAILREPQSEPEPARRAPHTLTICMALATICAIGEVIIRYSLSAELIHASQLAFALFTNVAMLGVIAVVVGGAGNTGVWLLGRAFPDARQTLAAAGACVLIAAMAAAVAYETDSLGFGARWPIERSAAAITAGLTIGMAALLAGRGGGLRLAGFTRFVVVATWLASVGATAVAAAQTNRHLEAWLRGNAAAETAVAQPAPNIILIVLDTLRADRVGVYGGNGLTPNMDRLAESSITYTNALSNAPWTLPTHASLFTGLYPREHGVSWGHYKLEEGPPTLAELLGKRGYDTFAISNNWLLSEQNGFARGFGSFIETSRDPWLSRWRFALQCGVLRRGIDWINLSADAAEDAGSAWTNWLVHRRLVERGPVDRPFFAFINYFEVHDPYRPPRRYLESHLTPEQREAYRILPQRDDLLAAQACGLADVYSHEQVALMSALYDAEVAYQDEALGELLEMLEHARLLADSWLVVTSDHGELFGEWDMVYHTAGSHAKLLHVPLFVRPPSGTEPQRVDAPVQPVDIFATLLAEAGIELPPEVRRAYRLPMGEDDPAERAMCIAETHGASIAGLSMSQRRNMQADLSHWLTWVTSVYADGYLLELDSRGPRGLYNLGNDPEMNDNLVEAMPERVQFLVSRFQDWSGPPTMETYDEHKADTQVPVMRADHRDMAARSGSEPRRGIH